MVAGLVAVVIDSGTGSGAVGTHRPGLHPSGYQVRVTFSGALTVHWGFTSGTRELPCGAWAEGGGLSKFTARSIRPIRGYLLTYDPARGSWAQLALLGKATGTAERAITINAGGVNWSATCPGTRPSRPSSIDCGERSFRTMRAIIHAIDGPFIPTLDPPDLLQPLVGAKDLLRLSMVGAREPFASCGLPKYAEKPHYAPTFILDRNLRVSRSDGHGLFYLRRGESLSLTDHYGGACTDGVPARDCAFVLDLKVTIKRV